MGVYKDLAEGGVYNQPFLLHIYDDEGMNLYLINDNADLEYDGHTYTAASFEYEPTTEGDAKLSVELYNNTTLQAHILSQRKFPCDLVGVYRGGEVVALDTYKHKYGEATWDGLKLEIKLDGDDRGNMTFPALIFNGYNNRGAE